MNLNEFNRQAWNQQSIDNGDWSRIVPREEVESARLGQWNVLLTSKTPVPREWFGDIKGKKILCLAAAGGQQVPILAAAGAHVISLDISDNQLAKDNTVATRDNLKIQTLQTSMTEPMPFKEGSFDIIFNPASTVFIPDVKPLWKECHRILKPGGVLMSGMLNPSYYMFDPWAETPENLQVRYKLPYSDLDRRSTEDQAAIEQGQPLEFGHLLGDLIGEQLKAGFAMTGFYEDWWDDNITPLNKYTPTFFATCSKVIK